MREIKFRAWCLGKMRQLQRMNFNNKAMLFEGGNVPFKGDYELMQFTGLHDKNGKEIYEWDILKEDDVIAVVRFGKYKILDAENLGFYLDIVTNVFLYKIIPMPFKLDTTEVIGNIYEHQHLLSEGEHGKEK